MRNENWEGRRALIEVAAQPTAIGLNPVLAWRTLIDRLTKMHKASGLSYEGVASKSLSENPATRRSRA